MPLDLLILRALREGARHGYSIARWIAEASGDALRIEEGSLYPALHRLEAEGWLASGWKQSETGRRAKFYRLTRAGRHALTQERMAWHAMVKGVDKVMS
jgi:PadR family transcriptional regulator, regulatory protein PadR